MLQCGEVREQIAEAKAIPLDEKETSAVNTALDAYFSIQSALTEDSVENTNAAAADLQKRADSLVSLAADNPMAAFSLRSLGEALSSAASKIATSDSIAVQRTNFKSLSGSMESLVGLFGSGLDRTVVKAHCPMAFNNTGADWLQTGTAILNPYFGSKMLKCGDVTGQLSGTPILVPGETKPSPEATTDTGKPAVHQH